MSDSPTAGRPAAEGQDPAYEIARELVGVLPFGARTDTVARCARITERVEAGGALSAVVEAIESVPAVHLPGHHAEPVAPAVVRRMLQRGTNVWLQCNNFTVRNPYVQMPIDPLGWINDPSATNKDIHLNSLPGADTGAPCGQPRRWSPA